MKRMRWIGGSALVVLALALAPVALRAQTSMNVHGNIKDKDNKPVAGATVYFVNLDNGQRVTSTTTDGKGNYVKDTGLLKNNKGYSVEPSYQKYAFTPAKKTMPKSGTADFVMNKGGFGQKAATPKP